MKTYMIGFSVSRNGLTSEIKCPCDEEEIRHVQDELDIPYDTDTSVTVIGVDSDIEQLSVLEGQTVDLDFLNLLGRLMDGMDCGEYEQFRIGLYHECFSDQHTRMETSGHSRWRQQSGVVQVEGAGRIIWNEGLCDGDGKRQQHSI